MIIKLMRFNRPKAKIHFKSDLNRLFIDFCDPIPAVQFLSSRRFDLNSDTDFESKCELYQKLVEFNQKWSKTTGLRHFGHHF